MPRRRNPNKEDAVVREAPLPLFFITGPVMGHFDQAPSWELLFLPKEAGGIIHE